MNPSELASALGSLSKGKKKIITEADRQRRRDWCKGLHKFRKSKGESNEGQNQQPQ